MQKFVFTLAAFAAATVGLATVSQAASTTPAVTSPTATKVFIPVVSGAVALSTVEKGSVDGMCGCPHTTPEVPTDLKPGYGFGTTGHYGPPGQGFTPGNSWRGVVAAGGTTTPTKGGNLPPRAFK
jgi:hypothetical protein